MNEEEKQKTLQQLIMNWITAAYSWISGSGFAQAWNNFSLIWANSVIILNYIIVKRIVL